MIVHSSQHSHCSVSLIAAVALGSPSEGSAGSVAGAVVRSPLHSHPRASAARLAGMAGLPPDTAPVPSIALETALLSAARLAYFAVCRLYVNKSLFADLREVIREDGLSSDVDTPNGEAIELDEAEGGYLGLSGNGGGAGAGAGAKSSLASRLREDGLGAALSKRASPSAAVPDRRDSLSPGQTGVSTAGRAYTRLSKALFCLAFSESCMLFTLLLFGDAVSDRYVSASSFRLPSLTSLLPTEHGITTGRSVYSRSSLSSSSSFPLSSASSSPTAPGQLSPAPSFLPSRLSRSTSSSFTTSDPSSQTSSSPKAHTRSVRWLAHPPRNSES